MHLINQHAAEPLQVTLNYIVDTGVRPVRYIDWPEMQHKAILPQFTPHTMVVRNGRPLRGTIDIDTHGFVFVDHHTQVKDFTEANERTGVYEPEVQALVRKYTGAVEVVVFDHTLRRSDVEGQGTALVRPTLKCVHSDYTETAAIRRLRELLGDQKAGERMLKRWALIQLWRPLYSEVLREPLAICDGRSLSSQEIVVLERHHRDRISEGLIPRHNPGHQWYYFPRMAPTEALVFKAFDSDTSKPSRFTAHSAFDDPATPADTPPRASIETRTFAFFD